MFSIILVLVSVQASLLPKNEYAEDQILNNFIDAFEDEKTIDRWMKATQRENLYFHDLFKGIINKIRDVLVCIHDDKFDVTKSLILNANMILDKVSYPYFETFNIIESVKRIVLINDNQNISKDDTFDAENFLEDFLYKEYEHIYCNLESTIIQVGLILDSNKTLENLQEWKNSDHCRNYKPLLIDLNLSSTINFMGLSNEMKELILPANNNTTSYVEAHVGGLKRSRKCVDSEIHLFIREKYTIVCPENMSQYLKRCDGQLSDLNEIDLKNYFGKKIVCNKTTAKVLVMLFHFYSEIKKRNTKYEIIMKEDNEYHIKWSLSKMVSLEEIENFWMKQEIQDLSNKKIIHKFGFRDEFYCPYSTNKFDYLDNKQNVDDRHLKELEEHIADLENTIEQLENEIKQFKNRKKQVLDNKMKMLIENETKPCKTKLILFSCGHQIQSDELAHFLYKRYYTNYFKPLRCYYDCIGGSVDIVGCYEAEVYEIR